MLHMSHCLGCNCLSVYIYILICFNTVHRHDVLKRNPNLSLKVHTAMCSDVGILKVFPGIKATVVSKKCILYIFKINI